MNRTYIMLLSLVAITIHSTMLATPEPIQRSPAIVSYTLGLLTGSSTKDAVATLHQVQDVFSSISQALQAIEESAPSRRGPNNLIQAIKAYQDFIEARVQRQVMGNLKYEKYTKKENLPSFMDLQATLQHSKEQLSAQEVEAFVLFTTAFSKLKQMTSCTGEENNVLTDYLALTYETFSLIPA